MGVLDEIKDSVSGSDSEKKARNSTPSPKSNTQDSFSSDDPFPNNEGQNSGLKGSNDGLGSSKDEYGRSNTSSNARGNNMASRKRSGEESRGRDIPNAQAGRPQQGSDRPQLSSNTRKKMENAGLEPSDNSSNREAGMNSSRGSSRASRGENSQASVSQDDFEDLKAQNQRIIELLQSINQNIQR